MAKGSLITLIYTGGITALLMLIFPRFRDDIELMWYNLSNNGSIGVNLKWLNTSNAFPIILGLCGLGTGYLLWWHRRPG